MRLKLTDYQPSDTINKCPQQVGTERTLKRPNVI